MSEGLLVCSFSQLSQGSLKAWVKGVQFLSHCWHYVATVTASCESVSDNNKIEMKIR